MILLKDFNEKYIYQSDKDKFSRTEVWEVMKEIDGKYRGDCESYMLTVLELGVIPNNTELHYCKIQGVGHCVGILDGMVIDCNCKKFMPLDDYTNMYDMTDLRKYWKIEVWWKRLATKVLGYVPFVG
jgi:hypothetical protein